MPVPIHQRPALCQPPHTGICRDAARVSGGGQRIRPAAGMSATVVGQPVPAERRGAALPRLLHLHRGHHGAVQGGARGAAQGAAAASARAVNNVAFCINGFFLKHQSVSLPRDAGCGDGWMLQWLWQRLCVKAILQRDCSGASVRAASTTILRQWHKL